MDKTNNKIKYMNIRGKGNKDNTLILCRFEKNTRRDRFA